jgi:pimeloyl-ACP methyl ester carboxylesterase
MTDDVAKDPPPRILTRSGAISIAYQRFEGKSDLPGVVFLSGFNSDMTGTKTVALEQFCRAREQSFLRFDYQGHGQSSGHFEDGTIGQWRGDAIAVFDALTAGPQVLVGSSMGGWLALLLALARPERVIGLACVAPAPDFTQSLMWPRLPPAAQQQIMSEGLVRLPSAYDPAGYVVTRALIEDGRQHCLLDAGIALGCPVRILQGTADADVPWQHAIRLAEAIGHDDVLVTLVKNGDHRLSDAANLARLDAMVRELSGLASG